MMPVPMPLTRFCGQAEEVLAWRLQSRLATDYAFALDVDHSPFDAFDELDDGGAPRKQLAARLLFGLGRLEREASLVRVLGQQPGPGEEEKTAKCQNGRKDAGQYSMEFLSILRGDLAEIARVQKRGQAPLPERPEGCFAQRCLTPFPQAAKTSSS